MRTLLLDQSYQPIATIAWQDAIVKWVTGKVEIIHEYDDRQIRSTHLVLKMPSVVRLINRFRRNKEKVRYSKQNVFARDRWKCQYCNNTFPISKLTVDHVIPRSQGGKTSWENVVAACSACNSKKANRTPLQAQMKLMNTPKKPAWIPVIKLNLRDDHIPLVWKDYCDF